MASDPVQFFVPGHPKAQGSKRHVGHGVMVEASKDLGPWRQAIAAEAAKAGNGTKFARPVQVRFVFWFKRPKHHYRTGKYAGQVKDSAPSWQSSAPDADKLCRAVADALTISGLILDDRLIARIEAEKRYGDPGVLIEVQNLEEPSCADKGGRVPGPITSSPKTEQTMTAARSTSSTTTTTE
jgi:crossover junction endodeoxyribonuclease RusA